MRHPIVPAHRRPLERIAPAWTLRRPNARQVSVLSLRMSLSRKAMRTPQNDHEDLAALNRAAVAKKMVRFDASAIH
jgi:hypothetical protein